MSTIEIGNEVVLIDGNDQAIHALDPIGTLIWSCVDGTTRIGEICSDLADAVGAPLATVRADTYAIINRLVELGIVVDAGSPVQPQPVAALPATMATRRRPFVGGTALFGVRAGVDAEVVGVACNDADIAELVRSVVAPSVVDAPPGPARLVLVIGAAPGALLPLHYLYDNGRRVLRTSNLGRLLRATLRYLDELARPQSGFSISGRLMVHDRGAIVIAAARGSLLELGDRGLAHHGWRTIDQPDVVVDPDSGEVVIREPRLAVDAHAVSEIGQRFPPGIEELSVQPGRHPLLALVSVGYVEPPEGARDSPAMRLARLAHFVTRDSHGLRDVDVSQLAALIVSVPTLWTSGTDAHEVTAVIRRLGAKAPMAQR